MHACMHARTHTHTHTHMFRFWLRLPSGWCSALTLSLCGVTQASMAGMSEDEYKKRVNFLKQQRDKLMEMKRKEREKQLLSATSDQPARPASARAARNALRQPEAPAEPAAPSEEEKKLAMRKAIANRIKSELMGKKWAVLLQCSFHPFTSSWPSSFAWFQMHLHLIWVWCLCVFLFFSQRHNLHWLARTENHFTQQCSELATTAWSANDCTAVQQNINCTKTSISSRRKERCKLWNGVCLCPFSSHVTPIYISSSSDRWLPEIWSLIVSFFSSSLTLRTYSKAIPWLPAFQTVKMDWNRIHWKANGLPSCTILL